MIYMVAYDLKEADGQKRDYKPIINAIESTFGANSFRHAEKSVWFVSTNLSADRIIDEIKDGIDAKRGDTIIAVQMGNQFPRWSGVNIDPVNSWLSANA